MMMSKLDPDELRAMMARPWDVLERAGARHWAAEPPEAHLRAAQELYDLGRQHHDWPSAEERAADLAAHQRLARLLQRADLGLARR